MKPGTLNDELMLSTINDNLVYFVCEDNTFNSSLCGESVGLNPQIESKLIEIENSSILVDKGCMTT